MRAPFMIGRWIRWSHVSSGPGGMLFAPAPTGRCETPASLTRQVQAAGESAITLVDPSPDFRAALRDAPLTVHDDDVPGGSGRMALMPEPVPWVLGPKTGSVRAAPPESLEPLTGDAAVRLRWLDVFLGDAGRPPKSTPSPIKHPPLSLSVRASRRMTRHCLRFVLKTGGYMPRTVLRHRERVRGCLWDAALKGAFHLRFSIASTYLWTRWDPKALGVGSEKQRRQRIRKWLPTGDIDTGDWVVFALVHRNLRRLGLPVEVCDALRMRCLQLSPLATLAQCTPLTPLAPLLGPRAVRLVECLDRYLMAGWREQLKTVTSGRVDAGAVHRVQAMLSEWLELLNTHQRLDLARALLVVVSHWAEHFDAQAVRQAVARRNDRQFVRDRLAELAEIGTRLGQLRQMMGTIRYGDERYAEAQLFLADYDTHFDTQAERCRQIARTMRRVIG